jgi:succinate dehydrogenase / fumarate reductase cytochrome b subunit
MPDHAQRITRRHADAAARKERRSGAISGRRAIISCFAQKPLSLSRTLPHPSGHEPRMPNFPASVEMPAVERPVAKTKRPVYLNLLAIRQPLPAIVSFLHRVSGTLLFLVGIPLVLCGVQASLVSAESYAAWKSALATPWAKLVLLALAWSYAHHLLAGIRHLVLDVHIGLDLPVARQSSAVVLVVAVLVTAAVAFKLW